MMMEPTMIDISNSHREWVIYDKNRKKILHRLTGPAIEWNDGSTSWWKNGIRHRDGGPALENSYGSLYKTYEWYQDGKLHCENGPARTIPGGTQYFYLYDIKYDDYESMRDGIKKRDKYNMYVQIILKRLFEQLPLQLRKIIGKMVAKYTIA